MVGGELFGPNGNLIGGPGDGQAGRDLRQDFVALRITPEHQIAGSNVSVRDRVVVFYGRVTAKLFAPVLGCVGHLGRYPRSNVWVLPLASWADHEKAFHEGVVDRSLEAVALSENA